MKNLLKFLAVIVFAVSLNAAMSADAFAQKKNEKWEKVVFSTHIHCESCVAKLEANLSYEKGVKDLKISLEDQTVTFRFDPKKTDKEKLLAAMAKIGYEGKEVNEADSCAEKCCGQKCEEGC